METGLENQMTQWIEPYGAGDPESPDEESDAACLHIVLPHIEPGISPRNPPFLKQSANPELQMGSGDAFVPPSYPGATGQNP